MNRILTTSINRRVWSRIAIGWAALSVLAVAQGSLAVPQALAAAAPTATTGTAQQVQFASATVTGTVNPNGSATTYYFEYGPTAAYGMQTSATSAGAGTADVAVHQPLSGLAPSTTYHYRLVAVSAGGTVVGGDLTFTTSKPPAPAVVTTAATNVSTTTALAKGTVNPEGIATTYYFQYGTTSGYGHSTAMRPAGSGTSSTLVSQSLSGLTARTTYHYRVVAVSAGGTVVGGDLTFTTAKTPAPTASTGMASAVSTTTATLNGSVNPHGVATSYYFQYGTKSPTTRTPVASAGAGTATVAVRAPLTRLAPGTRYVYRLMAMGASTTTGATRSFTTAKIPPGLSLTSTANPVGAGASVTFNGTLSGTGVGVRSVALEIEPYPYTAGFQQVGNAELTNASGRFAFTLPNLTINTMVRAVTVGGSPSLVSAMILEKVVVRVSVHVRRHGRSVRVSGLIAPAGAPVRIHIQRRVRGRWVTVARTTTHPISAGLAAYARTIGRPHRGRYRVVALVRDGSLLSGRSRVVTVN